MVDLFNFINDPEANRREHYKVYKKVFSGAIKESFLIDVLDKVEHDPRYGAIMFGTNDFSKVFTPEYMITGNSFNPMNVCKMIVMCHYAKTVSLTENERGKQQSNKIYKKALIDDVIKMFSLEKIATVNFSNSSLESYLPIIYYVSALCNYCANKYTEFTNKKAPVKSPFNSDINYKMIYKLLMKIEACITLSDIRATDELMVIYRSLIELFMTYSALWDQNDIVVNSFYEFDQAAFDYNYGCKIPDYIKTMAKDVGANEVQFLNYGWIKNIEEFKELKNKGKSFSLNGLAKILDKKCQYFCPDFGTNLYKFYKACNPQTHGTMLTMNYFQLELHIFQNIAVMLKFICENMSEKLFNFDFKYGNIDLIDELNVVLDESRKVFDWLNENQKELTRTNLDYYSRAICSAKMK